MKSLLLAGLLALATPAVAQPHYNGPEVAAPVKGVNTIILHTTDSAKATYTNVVRGLLVAGYGLDKQEGAVGYVSTTPKLLAVGSGVSLLIQATVLPTATGSDVLLRGLFLWASVLAQGTSLEKQQLPAVYVAGGKSPTQRAWDGLQQAATSALPGATVGYR